MDNKYPHHYLIHLKFVAPSADFREEAVRTAITEAIKAYNKSSAWAKNPKHIASSEYDSGFQTLTMVLQSQNIISSPGKALYVFSKSLVSNKALATKVYHSQLFRTQSEEITAPAPTPEPAAEAAPPQPGNALPVPEELERFKTLSIDEKLDAIYALLLSMKP